MGCESMDEDLSEGSVLNAAKNNQFTSTDDYAPKVRKPYTITKQRERWTEEEHKRFLEALRLHGRAWRRIEEHVGTKTAVQIRSHAQKFFSRVVRELTSGDGSELKPIEIPPPRPKRKPTHPYPRKLSAPIKTGGQRERSTSPNSSGSNQENQSPTSVLSAGGLNIFGLGDLGSPNMGSSHVSPANGVKYDLSPRQNESSPQMKPESYGEEKESSPEVGSTQSFKLFGKTVVIADFRPTDVIERCEGNNEASTLMAPWWSLHGGVSYPAAAQPCNLVKPTSQSSLESQNEGSLMSSNMCDAENGVEEDEQKEKKPFLMVASERSAFTKQYGGDVNKKDKCIKGFVPYKRCIEEREMHLSGEEKEAQRVRLNL